MTDAPTDFIEGRGDATLPHVAVIVPTYNRAASLAETLDGLVAQDYPPDRLEVVVVDDASTDDTAGVVAAAAARAPFPLRCMWQPSVGHIAARNAAMATTDAEVVGFTDSDCHVGPGWVRRAVAGFGPGVGLVAGPIRPIIAPRRRPGFFQHQIPEVAAESPLYPTANVFYRRAALEQVGTFDEHLGTRVAGLATFGEDTELAWRVKRAGYRAAFVPEAAVEHEASAMSVKAWLLSPLRLQALPAMVAQAPELRERWLLWRCFVGRGNLVFYLALLAAILGVRRARPLLLLMAPWLWEARAWVRGDLWPPSRWWRIPFKYALMAERFALTEAALIFGSIRHRTLVL